MAQYRYLFTDLLSNTVIAELPLTGVNFTQQLNAAGTFTGHLLLSGVNAVAMNVTAGTIPARTGVYVDRDGTLVWGGIIWSRDYSSSGQTLTIQAREFESYFERRRITSTVAFTTTDQLAIVRSLVNTAQAATNGNIGITVGSETSSVLVSRTYDGYELKSVFSAITDLSKSQQGFDFNIYIYYDSNGNPARTLRLGYPRYGKIYSSTSTTQAVLDLPSGNIVEYEYPEDGATTANTIYALGAGSNEGKLIATVQDATKISTGWPLLEDQANYSDITDSTLLTNLATSQVNTVSTPPITMKVIITTYNDPILGSYEVGDDIRIRITDDRFPTGLDTYYRLVAYNVTVGENGPERVTMTLTQSSY